MSIKKIETVCKVLKRGARKVFGEEVSVEMSRYINLNTYDEAEKTHPYYEEMLAGVVTSVRKVIRERGPIRILILGAGTGIDTSAILQLGGIQQLEVVDLDEHCLEILKKRINDGRLRCHCGDMVKFYREDQYDVILSVFSHDHVPQELGERLMKNIRRNLKPGGYYIMGGEILSNFKTEGEWVESLFRYHIHIIEKALKDFAFPVAHLEIEALRSGFEKIGDFKRNVAQMESELQSSGLTIQSSERIGPVEQEDIGGVYLFQMQKPLSVALDNTRFVDFSLTGIKTYPNTSLGNLEGNANVKVG